jgi:predicted nucleotidyltransferase
MKLHKDLREFIELLNSHRVEFVVVGGHAVAFHGYPRYTGDIDFFVRPELDNGHRILTAIQAFGFDNIEIKADDFASPDKIIQLGYPPNRIDLLTSISGCDFEEVWSSRIETRLDGIPVSFIGKDALIKNKQASNRSKDLADVEKLT